MVVVVVVVGWELQFSCMGHLKPVKTLGVYTFTLKLEVVVSISFRNY